MKPTICADAGQCVDMTTPPARPAHEASPAPYPPVRATGYHRAAVPDEAIDLLGVKGGINATDLKVLRCILRFVSVCPDSAWCPPPVAAKALRCSVRTVQRSYRSLERAELIGIEPVPVPDPLEHRNRTGHRIFFRFMKPRAEAPAAAIAPVDDEAASRAPAYAPAPAGLGDNPCRDGRRPVSPIPDTACRGPATDPVAKGIGGMKGRGKQTDDDGKPQVPMPACTRGRDGSSSSGLSWRDMTPEQKGVLANLTQDAELKWDCAMHVRVEDAVAVFGLEDVGRAIARTKDGKPWGYTLGILENWRDEGGPAGLARGTPTTPAVRRPCELPANPRPAAPDAVAGPVASPAAALVADAEALLFRIEPVGDAGVALVKPPPPPHAERFLGGWTAQMEREHARLMARLVPLAPDVLAYLGGKGVAP
jgi:hypothetical protein